MTGKASIASLSMRDQGNAVLGCKVSVVNSSGVELSRYMHMGTSCQGSNCQEMNLPCVIYRHRGF